MMKPRAAEDRPRRRNPALPLVLGLYFFLGAVAALVLVLLLASVSPALGARTGTGAPLFWAFLGGSFVAFTALAAALAAWIRAGAAEQSEVFRDLAAALEGLLKETRAKGAADPQGDRSATGSSRRESTAESLPPTPELKGRIGPSKGSGDQSSGAASRRSAPEREERPASQRRGAAVPESPPGLARPSSASRRDQEPDAVLG
ncbi:MAG: hypothetical protein KDD47_14880, partial [Acidobacteria bacterium]|nr:hypothetical protein [Acidobacteriota bacterium]